MSTKPGTWLRVSETASEFISKGIPEIGDLVSVEYEEKFSTPEFGAVKRFVSISETTENVSYSPEYGADYIYTGDII